MRIVILKPLQVLFRKHLHRARSARRLAAVDDNFGRRRGRAAPRLGPRGGASRGRAGSCARARSSFDVDGRLFVTGTRPSRDFDDFAVPRRIAFRLGLGLGGVGVCLGLTRLSQRSRSEGQRNESEQSCASHQATGFKEIGASVGGGRI